MDFISPHADKTLDILRGSSIVNMSLGATRIMTLRHKKNNFNDERITTASIAGRDGETVNPVTVEDPSAVIQVDATSKDVGQRFCLSHNSAFVLGWQTNLNYTHGIKVRYPY